MHTPAPWWVTDYGVRDRGGYICHTQPPTHFPDQDERFANEVEERKANARLIAAAPELLTALQFYANPEVYKPDSVGRTTDITFVAITAIAKATGSAA